MHPPPRILIVDDNDALRENITEALELEGYAAEAVASGRAALEVLASDPLPGIVLVDLLMPGMSGREFLAVLRGDPRLARLKVVVVSGLSPTREALPADAVLPKPFGVEDLLKVVRRLLAEEAPAATTS